ncbi:MAG TPA: hypothetical protein VJN92_20345 [Candidatus Acidoferrum sp.]|nr:hypothetical protein [Candidatus Acidoferrum sp.]
MASGLREAKGGAFGVTELRALLEISQCFNFTYWDSAKGRKIGRMRSTVLTPGGAAYHMHDECLHARIQPTRANHDDRGELGEGGEEFRIARHEQRTVWHEAHHRLGDREDDIEFF